MHYPAAFYPETCFCCTYFLEEMIGIYVYVLHIIEKHFYSFDTLCNQPRVANTDQVSFLRFYLCYCKDIETTMNLIKHTPLTNQHFIQLSVFRVLLPIHVCSHSRTQCYKAFMVWVLEFRNKLQKQKTAFLFSTSNTHLGIYI